MQVKDIMSSNPACVLPSDGLQIVGQKMIECTCGMLPVVDNTQDMKLVGIITDRDIVCRVVAQGKNCGAATVQDAMTTGQLWTAKPTDSVDTLIDEMEQGQVRRIPVVDDNNKVVGVVAMADIANKVSEGEIILEVVEEISKPTGIPHA